jgi:hypothetical protein
MSTELMVTGLPEKSVKHTQYATPIPHPMAAPPRVVVANFDTKYPKGTPNITAKIPFVAMSKGIRLNGKPNKVGSEKHKISPVSMCPCNRFLSRNLNAFSLFTESVIPNMDAPHLPHRTSFSLL